MIGRAIEFLIMRVLVRLFPGRYRLIPRAQDGEPLLRQFKIFSWLYLQSFIGPEVYGWFHRHRYRLMISLVLCGRFTEERYPGGWPLLKTHKAGRIYAMDRTVVHRLHAVEPRTWTLFFQFGAQTRTVIKTEWPDGTGRIIKRVPDWGYYPRPKDTGYVPWEKMIPEARKVKGL